MDLLQPAAIGFDFVIPFGGAAENFRGRDRRFLAGEEGVDDVSRIVRPGERFAFVVIDPALVPEFAIDIEDEHVRRCDRSEFSRQRLSWDVVQIRKVEFVMSGADFHGLEGVVQVGIAEFIEPDGVRTVWIDSNDSNASRRVIRHQFFDSFFVSLRGRTMVTREDDHEELRLREIL